MTSKVLVTGGAGFIGSHLVKRLLAANYRVAVIDNLSAGDKNRLPQEVDFHQINIQDSNLTTVFQKIKPEVVFHLAANSRATGSAKEMLTNNIIGTFNVLNAAKTVKIKNFIFTSSAAVYGEAKTFPTKEAASVQPISDYGFSKLTGEIYCQYFSQNFPITVFRFANVYGPEQDSSAEGGVVAIFIKQLLKHQLPILFGNGQQIRDFIYIDDVVEGMMLAINRSQSGTFNLSTNKETSVRQLLKLIAGQINQPDNFKKDSPRPGDITKSLLDNSLAFKLLGWQPETSLKDGIKQTINYFKNL